MRTESKNMDWYAVRVQNNKERKVLERIKIELEDVNLSSKLGNCIIPTEKVVSIRNGDKKVREKMVYPGYIFIETSAVGELTNIFKQIDGAGGFVRTRSGEIQKMEDREIKKIYRDQEEVNTTDHYNTFVVGEEVVVTDGPFSTFSGKISTINESKETANIQVAIFGRITDVELRFTQIEKKEN